MMQKYQVVIQVYNEAKELWEDRMAKPLGELPDGNAYDLCNQAKAACDTLANEIRAREPKP